MIGRALLTMALLGLAAAPIAADESDPRDAFFDRLSALCGEAFEGYSSFPEDGPFAGKRLRAEIAECGEDEIRIPFAVAEDRSRTWIVTRGDQGLLLKHDHRHEDGTPDEITMYGGWATDGGSDRAQSFGADDHTKELLPAAATNVWTLELGPEPDQLTYSLERHGEPRFKATLERQPSGSPVEIRLAQGTEREARAKAQLERLLSEHDLGHWLFTREIVIDEAEPIPHSHPVLTLNTDALEDDTAQLAIFLHEQFHWFRGGRMRALDAALADFRERFPEVPSGGAGARNEASTYLHLVICDLELQALSKLVGEEEARRVLSGWSHYTWIYEQVLENPEVRWINQRHGLLVPEPGDEDSAGAGSR